MNFMKDIRTLLRRRKSDVKEDSPVNVSMKDGDHGTIFGINRKIVIGIMILGVTTFVMAFIFSSSDEKQNNQPQKTKQEVATQNPKNTSGLPTDYSDYTDGLKNADANARGKGKVPNTGQVQQMNGANSGAAAGMTSVPQIPRSAPASYSPAYTLPSQTAVPQPAATGGNQNSGEETSAAQSVKDKFKAAIAFALGNGGDMATDKTAVASAQSGNNSNVTSMSYMAPSETGLQAGTLIPVILCSGINTDVGGQVVAQVSADIYDSTYGSSLLIPAGSRILGNYDAGKASTDGRVTISFSTIVLPNGGAYSLGDGAMVAVDGAGYNGIEGRVNNHTGRTLTAGTLSTALAAVAGVAGGNTSSNNSSYSTGQLAAQGAMSNLLNTASSLFQKGMNTQATVTVDPGYEFNVYITKGISFNAY